MQGDPDTQLWWAAQRGARRVHTEAQHGGPARDRPAMHPEHKLLQSQTTQPH